MSEKSNVPLSPAQRRLALLAIFFAVIGLAYRQPLAVGLPENSDFNFAASVFLLGLALLLVLAAIWIGKKPKSKKRPSYLNVVK